MLEEEEEEKDEPMIAVEEPSQTEKPQQKGIGKRVEEEIELMLQERQDPEDREHDETYFENLVAAQPDNSYSWIHYISYSYKCDGIEQARKTCERALKAIDMTKVKEKLNIWIAYMNLEYTFGEETNFQELVK